MNIIKIIHICILIYEYFFFVLVVKIFIFNVENFCFFSKKSNFFACTYNNNLEVQYGYL
jgi:hypothetical protein